MRTLLELSRGCADTDVLVVGESFLDGWLSGPSNRLCREAPVPIVDVARTELVPGAAANTAVNVAALGARVRFVSVTGDDPDGDRLRQELRARGVSDDDVLTEPGRRTVAKRRVISGSQLLARFDEGDASPVRPAVERRLCDRVERLAPEVGAVLLCDYAHGVFTPAMLDRLAALQAGRPRLLVVDARDPARWARVRPVAVTPNHAEAMSLLPGLAEPPAGSRAEHVQAHGAALLAASGARVAVVTLDTEGAVVLEAGRPSYRLYTEPVPHSQSAGAGDSFAAAFTLALAAGADSVTAAELGSAAARVVVRRTGTAVCTGTDLQAAVAGAQRALLDARGLAECARTHRATGRRLVFTNGCFDVLHRGHVAYLNRAKALGDVLIVGLNTDAGVRRLKGPDRPVNTLEDRAEVLAALSCVDHLAAFDGDTAAELLEVVRPDVYAKGGDYTPQMLPEAPLVERLGGQVRILDYLEDRSTTGLLERIRHRAPAGRR